MYSEANLTYVKNISHVHTCYFVIFICVLFHELYLFFSCQYAYSIGDFFQSPQIGKVLYWQPANLYIFYINQTLIYICSSGITCCYGCKGCGKYIEINQRQIQDFPKEGAWVDAGNGYFMLGHFVA